MSRFRPHAVMISTVCLLLAASLTTALTGAASPGQPTTARQATPAAYSCDTAATPGATPAATPAMAMSDAPVTADFDQTYIDMMLPHHASVIALAEAALPRLQNADLQMIAMNIIASQSTELDELSALRQEFYGSTTPEPMDVVMTAMAQYMPAAHDLMMADMAMMDSDALVAEFCAQIDADLAFIDLVIPHHLSAIASSEVAATEATHHRIRDFAAAVIVAQQAEVDQMTLIRGSLTGTPAA